MKISMAGGLVGTAMCGVLMMGAGGAQAQVKLPPGFWGFSLENMRSYSLDSNGKPPPVSEMLGELEMSFKSDGKGHLMGGIFTTGCVELFTKGEGRMHYKIAGGQHRVQASCFNRVAMDYEWTTNVSLSPGRMHFNGEARTVQACGNSRPDCVPERQVVSERAVIRVEGRKCFVESYQMKTTTISQHPYFKTMSEHVSLWTTSPKTTCYFMD